MLVREMIDAAGGDIVHVEWVSNMAQALTMLGIDDFGLFLVDRDLGGEQGADFIRRARDAGITTPAALYTGAKKEDLDEDSLRWLEQGVAYIHKSSVQPDELLRQLRQLALHTVRTLEVFVGVQPDDGVHTRIGRFALHKRICDGLDEARAAAEESYWDLVICQLPELDRAGTQDVLRLKAGFGLSPIIVVCRTERCEVPAELDMMRRTDDLYVLFGEQPGNEELIGAIARLMQ